MFAFFDSPKSKSTMMQYILNSPLVYFYMQMIQDYEVLKL